MNVIETESLGRRYGRSWALRGLDLAIPAGAVVGLVGPNGAGKSTLLHLVAGLISASEGSVSVLGGAPGSRQVMADVAFVAQDAPLPKRDTVGGVATMAAAMNSRWDEDVVVQRLDALGIERRQRVGELSGGQRAQFALALALAKRPEVLLLDEPVASLDPLARRGFLQSLRAAGAGGGLTVVFSTHLLDDLERACDHLVVLGRGSLLLSGSIDDIVAKHALLVGPPGRALPRGAIRVGGEHGAGSHQHLVTVREPIIDPGWQQICPRLDEIVLAHLDVGPQLLSARHVVVL